jgi:hypothetical protein
MTMLTKHQITTAASVLLVLEHEGATFASSCSPSTGLSAEEVAYHLVGADAHFESTVVEFREEAVCFSVEFPNVELGNDPTDCIDRAMKVRRALVNMSSN